jgi:anti-sigma regulatory factor (Ser/Thr protein kinase)
MTFPISEARLKIELTCQLEEVGHATRELEQFAERNRIPSPVMPTVQLALEEILTNIITHGLASVPDPKLSLSCHVSGQKLILEVTDNGPEFDPRKMPPVDITKVGERDVGGLGVYLVQKMMDGVDYSRRDNCNVLTLWKIWR